MGEGALGVPRGVDIFFQGKRTLLPLRKAEKKTVIFPYDPTIQASEMRNVVRMARGPQRHRSESGGQRHREGAMPGQVGARSTPPALGQVRELLETLPVLLLLLVLCGLDWALYSIFDTIRRHSFLQYSFRSERPETPPCAATHPESFHFVSASGSQPLSEPHNLTAVPGALGFQPLYIHKRKGLALSEGVDCAPEKCF